MSVLKNIKNSNDKEFEVLCIENRLKSLLPVLKSTEKSIRRDNLQADKPKLLQDLEIKASELWNSVAIFMRDNREEYTSSLCYAKVFATILLSLHESLNPSVSRKFRISECFIKTFYVCLDNNQKELAEVLKDNIDSFFSLLENLKDEYTTEEKVKYRESKIKLSFMNIQFSLLENNYNLCKFYESQANILENITDGYVKPFDGFNIARVFYNTGLTLFNESNLDESYVFLKKSCFIIEKIIENNDVKVLEKEENFKNLRQSSLNLLIKCCIKKEDPYSMEESQKLLNLSLKVQPNSLDPLKLLIDLYCVTHKADTFDAEYFQSLLMKMLMSVDISENYTEISRILNQYSYQHPKVTQACLTYILNNKIDDKCKKEQPEDSKVKPIFERCLISLVWHLSHQRKDLDPIKKISEINELLEFTERKISKKLSKECQVSIKSLLWSMGKKYYKEKKYDLALSCYGLCLHRLFIPNSETNGISKADANEDTDIINRSILRIHFEENNYIEMKRVLDMISEKGRAHPLTLYFDFYVHIYQNEVEQCKIILQDIFKSNNPKSCEILALTIIDAQKQKCDPLLFEAIELLIKKCEEENIKSGFNEENRDIIALPVVLRTAIHLVMNRIEEILKDQQQEISKDSEVSKVKKDIQHFLKLLKRVFDQTLKLSPENKEKKPESVKFDEYEWISTKSYNLAIQLFKYLENHMEDQERDNVISFIEIYRYAAEFFQYSSEFLKCAKETGSDSSTFTKWFLGNSVLNLACQFRALMLDENQANPFSTQNEERKLQWMKLKHDSIPVYQQCMQKFKERFDTDETTTPNKSEYKDNLQQSFLILVYSLFNLNDWEKINEILVQINKDITKSDLFLLELFDKVFDTIYTSYIPVCEQDKLFNFLIEWVLNKKNLHSEMKTILKWIKGYTEKTIDTTFSSSCYRYISLFFETLLNKYLQKRQKDDSSATKNIADIIEIEWLVATMWNKGVSLLM